MGWAHCWIKLSNGNRVPGECLPLDIAAGLVVSLAAGVAAGLTPRLVASLAVGLAMGLTPCLVASLALGLAPVFPWVLPCILSWVVPGVLRWGLPPRVLPWFWPRHAAACRGHYHEKVKQCASVDQTTAKQSLTISK